MKQQLFRVSAKNRKTGENISLQVWAENVDAATHSLTDALFGAKGAYVWTGSAPEHENNEVIKREIDEGSRGAGGQIPRSRRSGKGDPDIRKTGTS